MLKKILGEAPFDVSLDKKVIITPGKNSNVKLLFSNITQYDLPLSLKLSFDVSADVDKTAFDIIVPAGGKTESSIAFSKDPMSRMFTGKGICELEITDRIFDSKTLYEFEILCEGSYKCAAANDGFSPTDQSCFTNCGRFFANKGETVFVQIPLMENAEYRLSVISGKIKAKNDGDILTLSQGINRLYFEMIEDGSFELCCVFSGETVYPDTLSTKHFI